MRTNGTPTPLARQLDKWRQPLNEDQAVDDAVLRMLKSLDSYLARDSQRPEAHA